MILCKSKYAVLFPEVLNTYSQFFPKNLDMIGFINEIPVYAEGDKELPFKYINVTIICI